MKEFKDMALSESISGKLILVSETSSPGVLIHQTVNNSEYTDKILIYVSNSSSQSVVLTIDWGGQLIEHVVTESKNLQPVVPNLYLFGGLSIRVWADIPDAISLIGTVQRVREIV